MKKLKMCCLFMLLAIATVLGQSSEQEKIDLIKARVQVDSLDKQFSKHFFEGDSLALYNMYAKGAYFGTSKGKDILSSWGRQIRYSIENDMPNLLFTTTSLTTDNEFLFEIGKYEMKDSKGNLKGEGKYLLVWKQEDGQWKIYRDMGL
jgi:ketosteroid isomerase-like protein